MTHTYKVGDKGKTRGGDEYEVTGIGRNRILVYRKLYAEEKVYFDDGTPAGFRGNGPADFLIPPKRRIQGFQPIETVPQDGTLFIATGDNERFAVAKWSKEYMSCINPYDEMELFACVTHWAPIPDIDIEEGKGL